MASLAPPPLTRNRASSTNVRPPLTINTLGRRRSNSDLPPPAASPLQPASPVDSPTMGLPRELPPLALDIPQTPANNMVRATFVELYSRFMDLLRVARKESAFAHSPSSPRISLSRSSTSTDETLLPIASPSVATFAESYSEKPTQSKSSSWWHGAPSVHTPVFFVIALFPLSTALLLFCMATLPITQAWPRNITDLAQLGRELHGYSQSGPGPVLHVVGVLSVVVVWNHAWSIPGSVLWNVLAGALFSPWLATLLLTALTTVGSLCASLLSAPLGPFLVRLFPRALDMTRNAIEGSSSSSVDPSSEKPSSSATSPAWVRLSILRLVGIVPWAGLNVACGVCGVALWDCVLGAFIGSLPWTAVTCQIGDILQTVARTPGNPAATQSVRELLTSPEILAKLVFLSFLSLAPILGREKLRKWVSRDGGEEAEDEENVSVSEGEVEMEMEVRGVGEGERRGRSARAGEEERRSRWAWVREWRDRIRVPSRSRAREAFRKELEVLTQEKNERLPL
ncbi:hypothetical protein EIP86_000440 [Pleurotus ostreatoroseus]|nr:hypothetical protein EIP86_000440 [Pleurotus ostreatoroseus]